MTGMRKDGEARGKGYEEREKGKERGKSKV